MRCRFRFRPDNGMTVVAHGSVQVYGQQGRYQLYVDRLEPSGVGALALGVEQLKQRLSAEGLFDERAQAPAAVAAATSRRGHIAQRRRVARRVHRDRSAAHRASAMVLSPATVQGDGAVETLIRALQRADQVRDADVILLVRGGGSLEDLIAFNSEVARARDPGDTTPGRDRRRAMRPTRRSPTSPRTAAPQRRRPRRSWSRRTSPCCAMTSPRASARLGVAIAGLVSVRRDRVHIASLRLRQALMQETSLKRRALDHQTSRFAVAHPSRRVEIERLRLQRASERLQEATVRVTVARRAALTTRTARLATLSPRRTLERGYSITSDADGRVLTDAATVPPGARLRTVLRHGSLESIVDRVDAESPRRRRTDVRFQAGIGRPMTLRSGGGRHHGTDVRGGPGRARHPDHQARGRQHRARGGDRRVRAGSGARPALRRAARAHRAAGESARGQREWRHRRAPAGGRRAPPRRKLVARPSPVVRHGRPHASDRSRRRPFLTARIHTDVV